MGRLTRLVKDEKRVTKDDLKRLLDSQLDESIWGVILGALFGGLVSALVVKGVDYLGVFNLITQTVQQETAITIVAIGLVAGVLSALVAANSFSLWIKTRIMKDYVEAREIVEERAKAGSITP